MQRISTVVDEYTEQDQEHEQIIDYPEDVYLTINEGVRKNTVAKLKQVSVASFGYIDRLYFESEGRVFSYVKSALKCALRDGKFTLSETGTENYSYDLNAELAESFYDNIGQEVSIGDVVTLYRHGSFHFCEVTKIKNDNFIFKNMRNGKSSTCKYTNVKNRAHEKVVKMNSNKADLKVYFVAEKLRTYS